ncbi:MAG: ligase-associated DNA damage response endonuclease PdeM [Sphingobacteriia bacterium]|nr:MAG: ligase-associated DNA damage response endonuclease PdeM [Sphingobacteriia bacterium]
MTLPILHTINENHFWLSPSRVIFWEQEKILVLSDTHFSKTGHFRKNGIAVPQDIYKEDLQNLFNQVIEFKPTTILIVGDLFHSTENKELDLFLKWRKDFSQIQFILVRGNHDILHETWYKKAEIEVVEGFYQVKGFVFVHDPADSVEYDKNCFVFSGHIHPGILIKGNAKQSLRFPCFYFSKNNCILPAFSKFSGIQIMRPKKTDTVFAITKDSVIKC